MSDLAKHKIERAENLVSRVADTKDAIGWCDYKDHSAMAGHVLELARQVEELGALLCSALVAHDQLGSGSDR